nr:rep protein [Cressdnaviricota sp.]
MAQSKTWCFTSYKILDPITLPKLKPGIEYFILQLEKCPKTGRLHFQGYIQCDVRRRMKWIKDWLGDDKAHLECACGSWKQNRDYCSKEESRVGGPWEFGTPDKARGEAGHRSDLDELCEFVLENGCDAAWLDPRWRAQMSRYWRSMERLCLVRDRNVKMAQVRDVDVIVITGPNNTGKTPLAAELAGGWGAAYVIPDVNAGIPWFDGYAGQSTIVLEDLTPNLIQFRWLLRMMEGYPMQTGTKGGMVVASWTKVIITSNWHPGAWYNWAECDQGALFKRIKTWRSTGPAKGEPMGEYRYSPKGNTENLQFSPLGEVTRGGTRIIDGFSLPPVRQGPYLDLQPVASAQASQPPVDGKVVRD